MADLKSLKLRIVSIRKTQKITKAMKMVAASKLRRARQAAEDARIYAEKMQNIVTNQAANVESSATGRCLLSGASEEKIHLSLVLSTDRGLCGGLNNNIFKYVAAKTKELEASGKQHKIWFVGTKARDLARSSLGKNIHKESEGFSSRKIEFSQAKEIISEVIELFFLGIFDSCSIIFPKFKSAIAQEVTEISLISAKKEDKEVEEAAESSFEYEPSKEELLQNLVPQNLRVQLFQALLETFASEQGARMTAMDNAVNNCDDLIKKLGLVYNRTRQAKITTELVEIISATESL